MVSIKEEIEYFRNRGFGWECIACSAKADEVTNTRSRLMSEGEAESKRPTLSMSGLAEWFDREEGILVCPKCEKKDIVK